MIQSLSRQPSKKSSRRTLSVVLAVVVCICIGLQITALQWFHRHGKSESEQAIRNTEEHESKAYDDRRRSATSDTTKTTAKNHTTTAAACLLVMDDNHRLVEWLAYHHFTTNLRYVIVAVDPRSTTSPKSVLDRYTHLQQTSVGNNANDDRVVLEYEIWQDDDYMGHRMLDKRQQLETLGRKHLTMVHRVRQKAFYQYCLERLDAIGQSTWTLLLDVDEYLVVNRGEKEVDMAVSSVATTLGSQKEIMSTPGGIYRYLDDVAKQAVKHPTNALYEQFSSPCITIPRLLFGTKQDSSDNSLTLSLPASIQLDTMRWFYHAEFDEYDRNGLGKTILDLRRIQIPKPHFPYPVNPHRPFQDLCRDPKRIVDLNQHALLRVHHYISTWETYSFRNDSRKGAERSREAWEFRALSGSGGDNSNGGNAGNKTTDAVPWLEGFVKYHRIEVATQLLEGAGLPATYSRSPEADRAWEFVFRDEYVVDKGKKNAQQYDSNYGVFLRNRAAATT